MFPLFNKATTALNPFRRRHRCLLPALLRSPPPYQRRAWIPLDPFPTRSASWLWRVSLGRSTTFLRAWTCAKTIANTIHSGHSRSIIPASTYAHLPDPKSKPRSVNQLAIQINHQPFVVSSTLERDCSRTPDASPAPTTVMQARVIQRLYNHAVSLICCVAIHVHLVSPSHSAPYSLGASRWYLPSCRPFIAAFPSSVRTG